MFVCDAYLRADDFFADVGPMWVILFWLPGVTGAKRAFEPSQDSYEMLVRNFDNNLTDRVKAFEMAVGAQLE